MVAPKDTPAIATPVATPVATPTPWAQRYLQISGIPRAQLPEQIQQWRQQLRASTEPRVRLEQLYCAASRVVQWPQQKDVSPRALQLWQNCCRQLYVLNLALHFSPDALRRWAQVPGTAVPGLPGWTFVSLVRYASLTTQLLALLGFDPRTSRLRPPTRDSRAVRQVCHDMAQLRQATVPSSSLEAQVRRELFYACGVKVRSLGARSPGAKGPLRLAICALSKISGQLWQLRLISGLLALGRTCLLWRHEALRGLWAPAAASASSPASAPASSSPAASSSPCASAATSMPWHTDKAVATPTTDRCHTDKAVATPTTDRCQWPDGCKRKVVAGTGMAQRCIGHGGGYRCPGLAGHPCAEPSVAGPGQWCFQCRQQAPTLPGCRRRPKAKQCSQSGCVRKACVGNGDRSKCRRHGGGYRCKGCRRFAVAGPRHRCRRCCPSDQIARRDGPIRSDR